MAASLTLIRGKAGRGRVFPVIYDKLCRHHKDRNVVGNAWKEIVDSLDFADNVEEAKTVFVNLKKRYQKKKTELRWQEKSGTCLAAVKANRSSVETGIRKLVVSLVISSATKLNEC